MVLNMKRKVLSYTDKLAKLEQERETLLAKRKEEIFNLFIKYNAMTIDDKLLIGFLLFATNPDNKKHLNLQQFKDLALAKTPRKVFKQNSESVEAS